MTSAVTQAIFSLAAIMETFSGTEAFPTPSSLQCFQAFWLSARTSRVKPDSSNSGVGLDSGRPVMGGCDERPEVPVS